jgi:hypothetical protein
MKSKSREIVCEIESNNDKETCDQIFVYEEQLEFANNCPAQETGIPSHVANTRTSAQTSKKMCTSIQQFFTMHGLPWSESTQKYLEEMGADSVEILKLMEQSEWESIFANEKPLIRRLAVTVFEDLRKEKVQTIKCATTFNKNPNNNVDPSSGQKRKHHTLNTV